MVYPLFMGERCLIDGKMTIEQFWNQKPQLTNQTVGVRGNLHYCGVNRVVIPEVKGVCGQTTMPAVNRMDLTVILRGEQPDDFGFFSELYATKPIGEQEKYLTSLLRNYLGKQVEAVVYIDEKEQINYKNFYTPVKRPV